MKKLLAAAMILCLVLCLAACGDSKQPEPASQPSGTSEPAAQTPEEKPWAFTAPNGTDIALDDDMKDVLAAIGEPQSYFDECYSHSFHIQYKRHFLLEFQGDLL